MLFLYSLDTWFSMVHWIWLAVGGNDEPQQSQVSGFTFLSGPCPECGCTQGLL